MLDISAQRIRYYACPRCFKTAHQEFRGSGIQHREEARGATKRQTVASVRIGDRREDIVEGRSLSGAVPRLQVGLITVCTAVWHGRQSPR